MYEYAFVKQNNRCLKWDHVAKVLKAHFFSDYFRLFFTTLLCSKTNSNVC